MKNAGVDKMLSTIELAHILGRSERYVYAMKERGFEMPGRRSTIQAAIIWLRKNPFFEKMVPN